MCVSTSLLLSYRYTAHVAGGGAAASREGENSTLTSSMASLLQRETQQVSAQSQGLHCQWIEMWSIRTSHARLWRIGNYRSLSCKVSRNYALSWVLMKKHLAISQLFAGIFNLDLGLMDGWGDSQCCQFNSSLKPKERCCSQKLRHLIQLLQWTTIPFRWTGGTHIKQQQASKTC